MMTNLLFSQLTAIGKRFAMVLTMLVVVGVGNVWGEEIYSNTGALGTTNNITASGNVNDNNGNPKPSFGLTSASKKEITISNLDLSNYEDITLTLDFQLGKSGNSYSSLTVTQYNSNNTSVGSQNITGSNNTSYKTTTVTLEPTCTKCSPAGSTYATYVDNIKITGTLAASGSEGECGWIETDISNISSTDDVVITMTNGTTTWALTNGNGTSDTPVATTLTMNIDGSISENPNQISDAILWNISNNETLTIFPKGSSTTWLYCTNTNDGVRVGTNENQTFTIVNGIDTDAENYFLQHTATNRYVGVFTTNPDWRCYTLTKQGAFPTNLRGQTLKFYKYVECGSTEPTHKVTSTLSHVTADKENAPTINPEDEELLLSYSAESGWNLPATISVTMGGAPLSSETDYDWDNGDLLIAPASGFTGDIVVTINGWQQLAAPQNLKTTDVTATSATLSWDAVTNASRYLVTIVGDDLSKEVTCTQTSCTLEELTPGAEYLWTVKAVGDGTTYTDSEESETAEFSTKLAQYTITLNPNYPEGKTGTFKNKNGDNVDKIQVQLDYNTSQTIANLYNSITLEGYQFGGWYNAKGVNPGEVSGSPCTTTGDVKADKVFYAKWTPQYTIKWVVDGETVEIKTYNAGETLDLPTASVEPCPNTTHVGWTEQVGYKHATNAPSDLFTEASGTVTANKTYYAVFAEGEGGGGEYTLVTSANNFTDGVYVIAALDDQTYHFINGESSTDKGLGVETTGLSQSKVTDNKFSEKLLPDQAVEIDIEDDGEPYNGDHYYFLSYYNETMDNWYFLNDGGKKETLKWEEWEENLMVYTYHPIFDDGEYFLLSGSGGKISQNGTTKGSFIRIYGSVGKYYNSLYFFKKSGAGSSYSNYTTSCSTTDCAPTDIQYSSDLNSITISWNAQSATSTVYLYTDEAGTNEYKTAGAGKSQTFTGLNSNTTYYIKIVPGGDSNCASPIIPVTTKGIEMDIVEWCTDGIFVDVNTNDAISVTLENEVTFGSGIGSKAEDIFFSKYFEANGNAKILAIYNGTDEKIDLSTVSIRNDLGGQSLDLAEFGHKEVGYIYPGEEIILFNKGTAAVTECSEQQDSYPDWYNVEHGALTFGGRATLILKRGDAVIDIIGSIKTKGANYPNDMVGTEIYNIINKKDQYDPVTEKPSWGDGCGWVCESGDNIETDIEETDYSLSTNRCLLVRKNTVVSGANAVTKNIDKKFATLCEEWVGLQIPDKAPSTDDGVTESCEGMAFVGDFDYSSYYTQYVEVGTENFDPNDRRDDGTVFVPIDDLNKQSCSNIRVTIKDANSNVLTTQEYKVPIMITTDQETAYTDQNKEQNAFYALQENLATREVDGEGNVINTYPLSLDQVQEICKTCDVIIRDNATLTKAAGGNDHPQVRNVTVYEMASLVIPDNREFTINTLSIRRKEDDVARVSIQNSGTLNILDANTTPIYLDMRVNANNWHWFTLPYNCEIEDVTWSDGTPAQYNKDWFIMTYNGELRAATQVGGNWEYYKGTTIEAGKGYIVGILGNLSAPNYTYELRFPMKKEVLTNERTPKEVPVRAWGVGEGTTDKNGDIIRPNHKGWNLVGNPYLDSYKKNNINSFGGLRLGELIQQKNEPLYYEQTGNVPYIVIPVEGGWVSYDQVLVSETDLLPFTAYFMQVGNDNTHSSGQRLSVHFDPTKLQNATAQSPIRRAPSEVDKQEEPAIVAVELTNSKGESDKTTLLIADRFTNEYEMNADFFKWFGDYYKYYTKPVLYTIGADNESRAFNALNEQLAAQPVALGMYAAQAGNYTFSLNQRSNLTDVAEVWLHDANSNTHTNLMQDDYSFSTAKTNGAGRFSLSVKMASKVTTAVDNITANGIWATTQDNQIVINGLAKDLQLWIYDATGKLLHADHTTNYQHSYSVPTSGVYFVRVNGKTEAQTIKVVVE